MVTSAQFKLLQCLYRSVVAVGDGLGSEGTEPGLVLITEEGSLREACLALMPVEWQVYPLGWDAFVKTYATPTAGAAVQALMTLLGHFSVEAAYLGGPDFKPTVHTRRTFWICLFVDCKEAAGTRVLIGFERVKT